MLSRQESPFVPAPTSRYSERAALLPSPQQGPLDERVSRTNSLFLAPQSGFEVGASRQVLGVENLFLVAFAPLLSNSVSDLEGNITVPFHKRKTEASKSRSLDMVLAGSI